MSFTHLHVHSEHSFLDGMITLPGLVDRVLDLGQTAVAITDHGEVSGHLKFQKAANAKGVQPIFGMEGYFVDDVNVKVAYDYQHVTLLVVSQVGLSNLWKISSRAYTEGHYYKPRLDWKILQEHSEGIVATGGCLGGCVANYLIEGEDQYDPGRADERIGRFMDVLDGRFYLEVHTFPDDKQRQVNKALLEKGSTFGVPLLAVSDSHYLLPTDWQMHEMLIAAQMKKKYNDPSRYQYGPGALHIMGEDEVFEKLTDHLPEASVREAMDNTTRIAEESKGIQVEANRTFPIFLNKKGEDVEKLTRDANKMFEERLSKLGINSELKAEYRQRLDRELDLVIKKGYAGYFLITADVVRWAKSKGMLVGPGRGSAGGSLLSYVLGIIEVDPVANVLLFERFLDPNLKSLPDIDIDVPQLERHEVLEYLRNKYEVAGIGTLMTLKPKVLLNDFCRLLSVSFGDNEKMSKIIDSTDADKDDLSWGQVCERGEKDFKPWVTKYPLLFELCHAFAAHYRQAGSHAAAVVVNREPLLGKLPLRMKDDEVRTQMEMGDVEELGFMKMDFLGLRTLSTLMRALDMARVNWDGSKPKPLHFYDWQYEGDTYYGDEQAFKSMWDGKNLGIFQIETEGVSEVTKRYLPRSLEDMCAIVSLYRPGITRAIDETSGMNLLETALQKREGKLTVTYHHPMLEPILGNTYGAFLYQEQIMQTVRDIGDFSAEDQTKVRKALGKKLGLEKYKEQFVTNAQNNGMPKHVAEVVWHDMEKFGEYGFNKSHGFAYGMIAYWCAWMKHYYPEEFMTALFQTNESEKKAYNRECRRIDIPLLGPDVNESMADYALVNGRIRYGFRGVKFVGDAASRAIQEKRPYTSATELVEKFETKNSKVNKRTLESLILVGALDSVVTDEDREGLPPHWSPTKVALYRMFRGKLKIGPKKDAGLDEQGIFHKYLSEFKAYAEEVKVDDLDHNEPLYLGEHVTTVPFGKWIDAIAPHYQYRGYAKMQPGEIGIVGGTVGEIKMLKVKKEGPNKNRDMAQVWMEYPVIEDGKVVDIESQKLVCFPKEWTYLNDKLESDAPVIVKVERLADRGGYEGGLALQSVYRIDLDEFPGMHSAVRAAARVSSEDDPTQAEGYFD